MSNVEAPHPVDPFPKAFGLPWPDLNDGLFYADCVSTSDSGLTVIDFYWKKYSNSAPLNGWLQRINNGQVRIDGEVVVDPTTTVRCGSELVYHRLPWKEPHAPHILEVLYEDDNIIAVNKPSGLQVLPGGLFQQRTVLTQLQWRVDRQISTTECEAYPVPVHRLGRGTSGILLCAKTKLAKSRLASYFADMTSSIGGNRSEASKVSKIYRALIIGILKEDEVIIEQPIGMVRYPGVAKGLHVAAPSGKPALSKVKVLERDENRNCTLVQVEIQSGRAHQIRIHLSFIGHPLLGDPLYIVGGQAGCFHSEQDAGVAEDGGYGRPTKPVPGDCGYHLHAHQLILLHLTTNEVIKIIAPLPSLLRTSSEAEATESKLFECELDG